MRRPLPILAALLAPALLAPAALGQSMDFLAYGGPVSLSDDGQTAAVGIYRWTKADGFRRFTTIDPTLPSGFNADAVSGDGKTFVGKGQGLLRWSGVGTVQSYGYLPGYSSIRAVPGASRDGTVFIANGEDSSHQFGAPFVWKQSTGLVNIGRPRSDDYYTAATGVSRDGSTVVGYSNGSGYSAAFAWTASGGMHKLSDLLQDNDSRAWAVNSDGTLIVGNSGNDQATIWRNGTPYSLGAVQSKSGPTQAFALSADGSIVGGAVGNANLYAAVWTPAGGQLLVDYLKTFGILIPSNVRLERITSISADGKTFGGWAIDSSLGDYTGFVISVPAPWVLPGFSLFAFVRRRSR